MTAMAEQTHSLEELLGIHRVSENLQQLVTLGERMVDNAPQGTVPCCALDAGSLSRRPSQTTSTDHRSILIDMGGTHTKVAAKSASGEWSLLFDHLNDWFEPKRDRSLPLLQGFFRVLVSELVASLPALKDSSSTIRIAVIWSNQVKTKRFVSGKTAGVTGIVHGFQSGGYRKGEWFLQGLSNGDDIGALLLQEFTNAGMTPDVMVIGNDTLFTLFAVPGAHAGVVMSSGGNCTLVGTGESDRDELYNTELGGLFMIPPELLSEGDSRFLADRNVLRLSLEELGAGNWFPGLVSAHISAAATMPGGECLAPLAQAIHDRTLVINNRALCDLLAGVNSPFSPLPLLTQAALKEIVAALIERGATLAGLLSYLSVVNQLKSGLTSAVVSLDSSMARYFPGYFDAAKRGVARCAPPGTTVELKLVHPIELPQGGDISVPLQGAALAIARR